MLVDVKGRVAIEKFIGQDADRPYVYFFIVSRPLQQLWGQVERSSAEGASELFFFVDCPAEITQFYVALNSHNEYMNENDVFRFDVTMQYLVLVHQIDSIKKVTDDEGSRLLRKCGSI